MKTFADDVPLGDARDWLREKAKDCGADCPCCKQFSKIYRRSINSTMARQLIVAHQTYGVDRLFHLPDVIRATGGFGGDVAKLAYWDLLWPEPDKRDDGGRAGMWRVTNQGAEFAQGLMTVPRYALVYSGRLLGFDGEQVDIQHSLGKKFHLRDLLKGEA